MRRRLRVLMPILLLAGLFLWGCSKTIHEKKSTNSDPGDITQIKFTGSKVQLVHDF